MPSSYLNLIRHFLLLTSPSQVRSLASNQLIPKAKGCSIMSCLSSIATMLGIQGVDWLIGCGWGGINRYRIVSADGQIRRWLSYSVWRSRVVELGDVYYVVGHPQSASIIIGYGQWRDSSIVRQDDWWWCLMICRFIVPERTGSVQCVDRPKDQIPGEMKRFSIDISRLYHTVKCCSHNVSST